MQTATATKIEDAQSSPDGASCLHCGLPVPGGLKDFCCAGCASVYKTINELGLTEFYNYRGTQGKAVPFTPGEKDFEILDNSEFLNRKLFPYRRRYLPRHFLSLWDSLHWVRLVIGESSEGSRGRASKLG